MNCKIVVFDFDGTIVRSGAGIMRSAAYALEQLGKPNPGEATLRKFVGPPLFDSFRGLCGLTEAEAERAIELYRERYSRVGLFEAEVYPGIASLLEALRQNGAWVAVASGKPEMFLRRIIDHFGLTPCFDAVVGPDPRSHSADKRAQVRSAMPEGAPMDRAYMVGDRRFDMEAAKALGLRAVGVEYGYGSREELQAAGADFVAATVDELRACLLDGAPACEDA